MSATPEGRQESRDDWWFTQNWRLETFLPSGHEEKRDEGEDLEERGLSLSFVRRREEKEKVRKGREKRVKERRKEVKTWPAKEGPLRRPGWRKDVSFAFYNPEKMIKLDDWSKFSKLLSWFSPTCWELPVLKFRRVNLLQTWDVGAQHVLACRFRRCCCFTVRLINLTVFSFLQRSVTISYLLLLLKLFSSLWL